MAALTMGMLREILFVNWVVVLTSLGNISEYPGINKTSSNEYAFSGGIFIIRFLHQGHCYVIIDQLFLLDLN
jgi:hypothetical protein